MIRRPAPALLVIGGVAAIIVGMWLPWTGADRSLFEAGALEPELDSAHAFGVAWAWVVPPMPLLVGLLVTTALSLAVHRAHRFAAGVALILVGCSAGVVVAVRLATEPVAVGGVVWRWPGPVVSSVGSAAVAVAGVVLLLRRSRPVTRMLFDA